MDDGFWLAVLFFGSIYLATVNIAYIIVKYNMPDSDWFTRVIYAACWPVTLAIWSIRSFVRG